jgi:cytidylate kinase
MYLITISGKMGANGREIARQVAQQLDFKLYDTEAIEKAAQEMGFLKDVRAVDEKAPSLFERLYSRQPEVHLERLQAVIYELASRGSAVFLGRGSHILLKDYRCALQIRVTASLKKRIENLVEKGFVPETAEKAIHKSDHEKEAFTKFAFGQDWDNAELYDLVINTDHLSVDQAVDAIVHLMRSEGMKACSLNAMRSLEMMSLARKAEAVLIGAGFGFATASLFVSVPEPGKIQLTGIVTDQSNKSEAEQILKNLKGVKTIDNQIQVVSPNFSS